MEPVPSWRAVLAALLAPTVVTTVLAGVAAVVVGALKVFDVETSKALVLIGLSFLAGVTVSLPTRVGGMP